MKKPDIRPPRVRLIEWRNRVGMTQVEAALKLGVALDTYQRWENGTGVPRSITAINLESTTGIQWDTWIHARERLSL